jgi:hypothetical protein
MVLTSEDGGHLLLDCAVWPVSQALVELHQPRSMQAASSTAHAQEGVSVVAQSAARSAPCLGPFTLVSTARRA